jgi:hypothetical protein
MTPEQITANGEEGLKLSMVHTNTNINLADSDGIGDRVYGGETG